MLIQKPLSVNDIITLKLTTGEELVAKLVEVNDSYYAVSRPLVLVIGPSGVGLQQWVLTADPDHSIKINKNNVILCIPTIKEMSKQYLAGTSGLVV